jgi:hypothetical protein
VNPSVLFRVDDLHLAYDELTARGVVFEGARRHLIHRHDLFSDPDAQPPAVMSQVQPTPGS